MIIRESEMNFGPFDEKDVFYIEQSTLYKELGENVKIAEFVFKKRGSIVFVEAKASAPNPNGDIPEDFSTYIQKISQKLNNTFTLLLSAKLRIAKDSEKKTDNFIQLEEISNMKIAFRLVIREAQKEHLRPIQDALQKELLSQSKIWNIEVKVINADIARQYKIIS